MYVTDELQKELARFPEALRALVDAELVAGNTVLEHGHGHPAAPAGAYIKLANKVRTRPRASGDGLHFQERVNASHAGEFTDADQLFFVLEAADPPPPAPDMDAIRAEFEARVRKSDDERFWEMR
jgi:hypothetical protein